MSYEQLLKEIKVVHHQMEGLVGMIEQFSVAEGHSLAQAHVVMALSLIYGAERIVLESRESLFGLEN